jgi:hypothetical protein
MIVVAAFSILLGVLAIGWVIGFSHGRDFQADLDERLHLSRTAAMPCHVRRVP